MSAPVESLRSRPRRDAEDNLDDLELDIRSSSSSGRLTARPPASAPEPVIEEAPVSRGPFSRAPLPTTPLSADPPRSRKAPPTHEIVVPTRIPDAHGFLGKTPLAQVYVSMVQRKLSGSVVLSPQGALHVMVFDEGVLTRIASPLAPLGEVLATLGAIEEDEVAFAVERARTLGTALGGQLVEDGLADPETVATAVAAQTEERLGLFAALPPLTTFAFFAGTDVLASYPVDAHRADPLPAIMACVRGVGDEALLDAVLARLGARMLMLHGAAEVSRFGLTRDEAKAVEIIQWASRPYADLFASLEEGHAELRRVAYALAITKHLDVGDGQWPLGVARVEVPVAPPSVEVSAPPEAPTKPPPASVSSAPATPRVAPAAARPKPEVALSLARTVMADPPPRMHSASSPTLTSPSQVQVRDRTPPGAAVVTPASGLRPAEAAPSRPPAMASLVERNAVPEPATGDRASVLPDDRISAMPGDRISALPSERLSRPSFPGAAPSAAPGSFRGSSPSLPPPSLDAASIAAMSQEDRVVMAATFRQRAEVCLARNDTQAAEKAAQTAVDLHRENADGLAVLGWLLAMKPGNTSIADGIKHLDEAIRLNPESDRALFYRGVLLKRANRLDDALRDFKAAVDKNPKNLDAVRELRLQQIRAEKGLPKGLFGRFLRK